MHGAKAVAAQLTIPRTRRRSSKKEINVKWSYEGACSYEKWVKALQETIAEADAGFDEAFDTVVVRHSLYPACVALHNKTLSY